MKNLKNKKIIVTGATGGIGYELVKLLVQEDASLILVASNEKKLQEVSHEIKADYIQADFSTIEGIKDAAEIFSELEKIDIVIHLSGIMEFNSLGLQKPENIEKLYNINLLAPVLLTQAILPEMIKNRSGHIVNIGSIFGSIAFPYFATYSSSKAAVRGFSESLRRELKDTGVKVTYIAPRAVNTAINSSDKVSRFLKETKTNIDEPFGVAKKILKTIKQEKSCSYFGFPESLFVRLNYLFPSLVDNSLKQQTSVARDILMEDNND